MNLYSLLPRTRHPLLPNSGSIRFLCSRIMEDAQRAALAGSPYQHTRRETIPKVLTEALVEKTGSALSLCAPSRMVSPRVEDLQ